MTICVPVDPEVKMEWVDEGFDIGNFAAGTGLGLRSILHFPDRSITSPNSMIRPLPPVNVRPQPLSAPDPPSRVARPTPSAVRASHPSSSLNNTIVRWEKRRACSACRSRRRGNSPRS